MFVVVGGESSFGSDDSAQPSFVRACPESVEGRGRGGFLWRSFVEDEECLGTDSSAQTPFRRPLSNFVFVHPPPSPLSWGSIEAVFVKRIPSGDFGELSSSGLFNGFFCYFSQSFSFFFVSLFDDASFSGSKEDFVDPDFGEFLDDEFSFFSFIGHGDEESYNPLRLSATSL